MSDKCIYQSEDIEEARCTILLILQPKYLKKPESWLCEYRKDENHCPIYNMYISYAEKHHEDCCSNCEHNIELEPYFDWSELD